jgi:hypothetical protein
MLTFDEVDEILSYDPNTGYLKWKIKPSSKVEKGDTAGTYDSHGYIQIGCRNRVYRAHRLAWLLAYGEYPSKGIDHHNGVRDDNRLFNLREANQAQNNCNRVMNKSNKSGFKGVYKPAGRKRFLAQIKQHGVQIPINGSFATAEEASEAYEAKAKELFGEFYREL